MDALGAALPRLALADADAGPDDACGSPCSVASDCSSVASADFEGLFSPSGADAAPPSLLSDDLPAAAAEAAAVPGGACRSVFALDSPPLWGLESVCGRRPEMEDAAAVVPRFYRVPLWMVAGDGAAVDGLDRASFRLPAHFFAVYDGHGGAQVADYCRDKLHAALAEELRAAEDRVGGCDDLSSLDSKKQWEKAFVDCFCRVDAEVEAPDSAGSTAVAAVLCSSHIIVSNCGDSRAVLCRGKAPLPLSLDHKALSSFITFAHCPCNCLSSSDTLSECCVYSQFSPIGKTSMRGSRLWAARSSSGMDIEFSVFLPCRAPSGTDT
uniref:protein-serine/threonine phosphatase n=2 Tax=Aegilops tauschii subsp. strangulata TaxID=200361 RepID=A0A453A4P4_AEGTS